MLIKSYVLKMIELMFLFTFARSQLQFGVNGVTPNLVQSMPLPYMLTKVSSYCKNHGQSLEGELKVADTLVLEVPGGVVACAQSVMFHFSQNMCSDVFWANNNQCACLRPGVACKEEKSDSGFSIFQLTSLQKQHYADSCTKLEQAACEKHSSCQWKVEASACEGISLSKEHYAGVAGAYPAGPQLGAYGAPGAMPGVAPNMLNTQLVPWREGFDCEREIDDHTQLSNIIDLPLAANPQTCLQYVQGNMQCNQQQFVFQKRVDGFPGECSCVRVNLYCDEETRPGWQLYDFTKGPGAFGGVPPAGGYPQAHGMPPAGATMAGAMAGAYPGAHPGAYGAAGRPGYGAMAGAMAGAAGYGQRPQAGYPGAAPGYQAGAYQAGAPGLQAGAYPAAGGYAGASGYQAGYRGGMRPMQLQKKSASNDAASKSSHLILLYAVLPMLCGVLFGVAWIYKRQQGSKQRNGEHVLMDDHPPAV